MGWFITGCIVIGLAVLLGLIALAVKVPAMPEDADSYGARDAVRSHDEAWSTKRFGLIAAVALAVVGAVLWGLGSFYTQDPGEAKVIKSISGDVQEQPSVSAGFHGKAPWESAATWDIRDNTMSFAGADDKNVNFNGGDVAGPRITVQDSNDVDAFVDMTVRYSIEGDRVVDLYSGYGNQEDLFIKVVEPDVRSAVREAAGKFSTDTIVTERAEFQAEIRDVLEAKWAAENFTGVVIESVSVQETVQPEEIKAANAAKAAALVNVETEKARLEQAKIEAQKNAAKTKELSPEILTQQYIDAMKDGTIFVVPEGSTPLVQIQK